MPTRLQNGLSMPLLQWAMASAPETKRRIELQLSSSAVAPEVLETLKTFQSVSELEMLHQSPVRIRLQISARDVIQLENIANICAAFPADDFMT